MIEVDQELLGIFSELRIELKKPLTERALNMLMRKLDRLQAEGHCPNLLLERSIVNGWQDVWPDSTTMMQKKSFAAMHTDREWRESFIETHNDSSWADVAEALQ